jgi:hypothetical protein
MYRTRIKTEISEIILEDIEKLKKRVQHFLRKNSFKNSSFILFLSSPETAFLGIGI